MSSQIFCHNCGVKLPITSKFCSSCGTSLASLSNKPEPPSKKTQTTFVPFDANGQNDEDYNEYDHMERLPKLVNGLELEVNKTPHQVEKLGGIMAMGGGGYMEKRDTPYANVSNEKFLEQFAKEAGNTPVKSE